MFLGRDLLSLSEKELRPIRGRRIATIFQDPSAALNPLMSVTEQIVEALPRDVRRGGRTQKHVESLLKEVGLDQISGIFNRHPMSCQAANSSVSRSPPRLPAIRLS